MRKNTVGRWASKSGGGGGGGGGFIESHASNSVDRGAPMGHSSMSMDMDGHNEHPLVRALSSSQLQRTRASTLRTDSDDSVTTSLNDSEGSGYS
jgi:hypothetical protein